MLAILGLLIAVFYWFRPAEPGLLWLLRSMLFLALLALLKPEWLAPFFGGVMLVTRAIGWLTNKILLSLVFFGILVPLGLLRRLFSGAGKPRESTWITRNKTFQSEDLTKTF